jgi:hypothetical protein
MHRCDLQRKNFVYSAGLWGKRKKRGRNCTTVRTARLHGLVVEGSIRST